MAKKISQLNGGWKARGRKINELVIAVNQIIALEVVSKANLTKPYVLSEGEKLVIVIPDNTVELAQLKARVQELEDA
jgi:hypothetical protein